MKGIGHSFKVFLKEATSKWNRRCKSTGRQVARALRWDQEQAGHYGMWDSDGPVEARRKARRQQEEEQGRHPGQEESKQDKQVDLGDEEQAGTKSTDKPEVTGRLAEIRTGRGSQVLSVGEMRDVGRTRPRKAKERVTEERVNMKAKEELEAKEDTRLRTQ